MKRFYQYLIFTYVYYFTLNYMYTKKSRLDCNYVGRL